jgi:uncharacterized protein YegP (UPF0339 family)
MRQPRFEVVRTDAGWHSRFRAANGRIVWTTEVYERERAAVAALYQIAKPLEVASTPWPNAVMVYKHGAVELRTVDERTP